MTLSLSLRGLAHGVMFMTISHAGSEQHVSVAKCICLELLELVRLQCPLVLCHKMFWACQAKFWACQEKFWACHEKLWACQKKLWACQEKLQGLSREIVGLSRKGAGLL